MATEAKTEARYYQIEGIRGLMRYLRDEGNESDLAEARSNLAVSHAWGVLFDMPQEFRRRSMRFLEVSGLNLEESRELCRFAAVEISKKVL